MRSSRQRSVVVGLGLLVLLVGAWWWFGASALAWPEVPVRSGSTEARGEATPAGSSGWAAPAPPTSEERLEVVLPAAPPGPIVAVRAVDAFGLPVEGAEVLVRGERDAVAQPFVRTGADGTCKVALGAPVQFVRAHDEAVGTSIEVRIVATAANDEPIVLPLLRPVVVRGRVVLRDAPVGVVRVQVRGELRLSRVEPGIVAPLHAIEASGPDRSFTFEAAAGATLRLGAVDEQQSLVPEMEVVAVDGLEVVLAAPDASPMFEVRGVVLDPDGRPVQGPSLEEDSPPFLNGLPMAMVSDGVSTTFVGQDGRFVLPVGSAKAVVRARSGHQSSEGVACEFHPTRRQIEVVLQLRRNVPTRGTVDRAPVDPTAVRVSGIELADDVQFWWMFDFVGTDGTFEVALPVGSRWRLAAGGDPVEVVAGQQGVRLGVTRREPEQAEVRLRVAPVSGKELGFPWAEWVRIDETGIDRDPASFVCLEGEAAVHHPRTSPWRLVVHDGAAAAHVDVDATAIDLGRVFLLPPARLLVTVRRSGRPMRGLDVLVEGCGPPETGPGNPRGVHHFTQLPHGPAFVHVRRGAEVLATQRIELFPGQVSEVSFDLP